MASNEPNPNQHPSNLPLLLDFAVVQLSFPIQPEDSHVIERNRLLENELSYLKVYNVSLSNETFMDYFTNQSTIIGRGKFGVVFRVDYPGSVSYALKRIQLVGAKNDDEKKLREIDISQALYEIDNSRGIHPNVVRTYFYCIDFDNLNTPWINLFMELCEESLADWFKKKENTSNPKNYALKKKMFLEICEGLKNIHSKSILHRDLKPENILLDSAGTCKIADFGLSRLVEGQSSIYVTQGQGTPRYSAPEKFTTQYDSRIDIFSLGCIWMEFLADFCSENEKNKAFNDLREIDLTSLFFNQIKVSKNRFLPPMFATNFPEEGEVIMKMTSHQPEKRPSIDDVIAIVTALTDE